MQELCGCVLSVHWTVRGGFQWNKVKWHRSVTQVCYTSLLGVVSPVLSCCAHVPSKALYWGYCASQGMVYLFTWHHCWLSQKLMVVWLLKVFFVFLATICNFSLWHRLRMSKSCPNTWDLSWWTKIWKFRTALDWNCFIQWSCCIVKPHNSSILVIFGVQICAVEQLHTVLAVLTFEVTETLRV